MDPGNKTFRFCCEFSGDLFKFQNFSRKFVPNLKASVALALEPNWPTRKICALFVFVRAPSCTFASCTARPHPRPDRPTRQRRRHRSDGGPDGATEATSPNSETPAASTVPRDAPPFGARAASGWRIHRDIARANCEPRRGLTLSHLLPLLPQRTRARTYVRAGVDAAAAFFCLPFYAGAHSAPPTTRVSTRSPQTRSRVRGHVAAAVAATPEPTTALVRSTTLSRTATCVVSFSFPDGWPDPRRRPVSLRCSCDATPTTPSAAWGIRWTAVAGGGRVTGGRGYVRGELLLLWEELNPSELLWSAVSWSFVRRQHLCFFRLAGASIYPSYPLLVRVQRLTYKSINKSGPMHDETVQCKVQRAWWSWLTFIIIFWSVTKHGMLYCCRKTKKKGKTCHQPNVKFPLIALYMKG